VDLAHRVGREEPDLRGALRAISEASAGLLGADRAGIWLLEDDERLRCAAVHGPGGGRDDHGPIERDQAPEWFGRLQAGRTTAVEDVRDDGSLAGLDGLRKGYLEPGGVRAVLASPVRRDGEVLGFVSHEMVDGPRSWAAGDRAAAGLVADLVARAVTARTRREDGGVPPSPEGRYRDLFERNVAGVYRTTPDGEILEANRACAEIFGYDSPEELREALGGEAAAAYVNPEDRERAMERLRARGRLENHETRMRRADGSVLWVLENALLVDEEDGGQVIEGTLIDITHRKRLEAELELMAYHDALTGLANRRLLAERAEKVLALADREGEQAGLVYIDLARFKRINDTLGHAAGDRVLVEVGQRLQGAARESDTVARVGGDEFAVLLAEVSGGAGAVRAAERLARTLEEPIGAAGRPVHVDARFGVSLYPDHADDYDALLTAADRALTRSYSLETSTVHLYQPGASPDPTGELELEEELREALEREDLALYYQPIVRMAEGGGTPEGVEALLRWHHPDRGLLPAGEFIHLAERGPLIHRLDRWVLRQAIRQTGIWARGEGPSWTAVNLSAASLRDRDLVDYVAALLEEEGLEGSRLVVELTERTAVRNPDMVTDALRRLREMGVGVAIDDFGTGHSALAYLKSFPASLLKMDGFFIQDLEGDERQSEVARAIIRLGGAVGMRVAAERVENDKQQQWLEDVGCELGQGFWIGEPVPPEEVMSAAAATRRRAGGRRGAAGERGGEEE
jgi:diguanylate cyclase (GGDEF)-like protein/PAS domain S-box-containing protein